MKLYSLREIQELAREGRTQNEIADIVGISRSTVQRALARVARGEKNDRAPEPTVGGRLTKTSSNLFTSAGMRTIVPPPNYEGNWQTLDLDRSQLRDISPSDLTDILANISPDISRALWDTLRMIDPGHDIVARVPKSKERHEAGQLILDQLEDRVDERQGSLATVIGKLSISAFMRGAIFAELVLDKGATTALDIVVPDPLSVRFRLYDDPVYGESYELGQWQSGNFVNLERPTIIYEPIDPMPGPPYGRAPIVPAIFPSLFLLSVMHDLKRVISQAGYLRVNIKILVDKVQSALAIDDVDSLVAEINSLVEEVGDAWHAQEPDDSYVYPDYIEVVPHEGAMTMGDNGMAGADSLIAALERMLVRALKSMPIVMGAAEGVSEANADRQWEMYMATISSLQKKIASVLSRLLTLAMEVEGVQAVAEVDFDQVRAAEAYRDAQTDLVKIAFAQQAEDAGYMTHDEASQYVVNHDSVAEREEEVETSPPDNSATDGESDADQELNRLRGLVDSRGRRLMTI
jgi:hypothetical protein